MRFCPKCQTEKLDYNFFKPQKSGKRQSYCKSCNAKNTLQRQRAFKQKLLDYKGGSCSKCGYNKCPAALEFHHLDPSQKDFSFSRFRSTSWEKSKDKVCKELDKCILLCANCHREAHWEK
jgi:hypothetical protein